MHRSPGQLWLWGLTIATAVLAAIVQQPHALSGFLSRHRLPSWPLHPLGLPLVGWWALLFLVNEIWVRRAGVQSSNRWIEQRQRVLSSTSGNIDYLCRCLVSGRGRLTEEDGRAVVRSLLARIAEYARLSVNTHEVDYRACCLLLRTRVSGEDGGEAFLEAWEYDAPHNDAHYSTVPFGEPLAGVVARARASSYVDDVLDPEIETRFPNRRYRSIIGFPILVGGPGGQLLGVVTVDASAPGVFARGTGTEMEKALSPVIALIGLALKMMRDGRRARQPLPAGGAG